MKDSKALLEELKSLDSQRVELYNRYCEVIQAEALEELGLKVGDEVDVQADGSRRVRKGIFDGFMMRGYVPVPVIYVIRDGFKTGAMYPSYYKIVKT